MRILLVLLLGCLWDTDTLQMERQRFPDALELITGKFLRHSKELYRWRIEDRTRRLAEEPHDLALYDDLAVAYDKVGEQEKAIATMEKKEAVRPGLYETYANLGTFHIHAGRFEKGVELIDKAIAINPDAHFGREIYQRKLVTYVLSRERQLPLEPKSGHGPYGFAAYVIEDVPKEEQQEELKRAKKGILGMMRFGHHDSPYLLEALAHLLTAIEPDAKRLAARAYLKASYEMKDKEARKTYRKLAAMTIRMHEDLKLRTVEKRFRKELHDAKRWYARLRADEMRWIAAGRDVDAAFTEKYYAPPRVKRSGRHSLTLWLIPVAALGAILAVQGFRRRRD